MGQHPATMQPHGAYLLQPVSLPRSELGRALLQQDQALSPGRNALLTNPDCCGGKQHGRNVKPRRAAPE